MNPHPWDAVLIRAYREAAEQFAEATQLAAMQQSARDPTFVDSVLNEEAGTPTPAGIDETQMKINAGRLLWRSPGDRALARSQVQLLPGSPPRTNT